MTNIDILVSVIIPAYNTETSLKIILDAFEKQRFEKQLFEVIVVDDGSTKCHLANEHLEQWKYDISIIRQKNKGRAAARNQGASLARGKYLVFCDADRIPNPDLIAYFLKAMNGNEDIVCIGNSMDYFGSKNLINESGEFEWAKIVKNSRESNYFKNIINIYDEEGKTDSKICWASFLVGTSCVSRKAFEEVGGFDEKFTDWGFEHYDLGIRLLEKKCKFICLRKNCTFHIPHKRESGFYLEKFKQSQEILSEKYKNMSLELFYKYMEGAISLQDFEKESTGNLTGSLINKAPLFLKIINF